MAPGAGGRTRKKNDEVRMRTRSDFSKPFPTKLRLAPADIDYIFDPSDLHSDATVLRLRRHVDSPSLQRACAPLTTAVMKLAEEIYLTLYGADSFFFVFRLRVGQESKLQSIANNPSMSVGKGRQYSFKPSQIDFTDIFRIMDEEAFAASASPSEEGEQSTSTTPNLEPSIPNTSQTVNTNTRDIPDNASSQLGSAERTDEKTATNNLTAKKGRKLKYRKFTGIDFSNLSVRIPQAEDVVTVLYRPTDPQQKLSQVNSKKLYQEFSLIGQFKEARNISQGGLALDFPPETHTTPLLALTNIAGIHVKASLPASRSVCHGVATGIHWEIDDQDLVHDSSNTLDIPVVAAKRLAKPDKRSWVVKFTFAGAILPDRIFLYGRSHPVRPFVRKPIQCGNCGRLNHSALHCRSARRCFLCSADHSDKDCVSVVPKCLNCGEAHKTDAVVCQARAFESAICKVQASSNISFKVARSAVTSAARSYASAAAKQKPTASKQKPAAAEKQKPAAAASVPSSGANFIGSVPHHRPPISSGNVALSSLLQAVIALVSSCVTGASASALLAKVNTLFGEYEAAAV